LILQPASAGVDKCEQVAFMRGESMEAQRTLFRAAAILDAAGTHAAPGALLMDGHTVIAAGAPETVGTPADADVVNLPPGSVMIPALVNAHTHLDLTNIGPKPHEGTFVEWIRMILRERGVVDDAAIAAAVRGGVQLLRRGGTALAGDIAGVGSAVPLQTQREAGMPGVSFMEFFGLGERQNAAIEQMKTAVDNASRFARGVALGVQPHAPYSCGPRVYAAAAKLGLPLATHLAETSEEVDFTTFGGGAFADFLRDLGLWHEGIDVLGAHPVAGVLSAVDNLSILAVHVNYLADEQLEMLARGRAHVIYCPRASAYFGHAGHRYQEMASAGINVALGTDSIICLDTPERISVLDEMRLLRQRDGVAIEHLLRMATTNGARALGFDESMFTFQPGLVAGVLAIDAGGATRDGGVIDKALARAQDPRWVVDPLPCEQFTRA